MVLSKYSDNIATLSLSVKGVLKDTLLLIILCLAATPVFAIHRDTIGTGARTYFVENLGQWDSRIIFASQLHQATLYCEADRFTFILHSIAPDQEKGVSLPHPATTSYIYRTTFVGCNQDVTISGDNIDPNSGYDNYYLGKDPARWVSHLPHYTTINYQNLYPGIDMEVLVAQNALKNNYYVQPGASPSAIVLRYDGAEKLYLSNGNLIIRTSIGEIVEIKPYAYQQSDTGEVEIPARYQIRGNEVRFIISDYDTTQTLIIDPILHFSTYTGSTADNWGTTATYDSQKNSYTAGLVLSYLGGSYPTSEGAYDQTLGGESDIGIFKFDPTGSQRIYATYLGGSLADMPHSMYVNSFNELVVFGTTGSSDFPTTPDAYDRTFNGGETLYYEGTTTIPFTNGSDIFVCRFSEDGTALEASTYVGGSGNDGLNYKPSINNSIHTLMCGNGELYYNYGDGSRGELITDDQNNIYVGSTTFSTDFPTTPGVIQELPMGGQNGVVFKLDYSLSNLLWSTYLGGSADDAVYSIDVDTSYNVVVCGGTNSDNFPVKYASYQRNYGGGRADGFVAIISYFGDRLISGTYFGSAEYDQLYFARTSKRDDIFVYGQTLAPGSTMIHNANYNVPGAGMLLARFNHALDTLRWSTVFGEPRSTPNLSPTAFACDICDRVYASGWGRDYVGYCQTSWNVAGTTGMETTSDAIQSTTDGQDFYIISLDENASQLEFATFFGELHDQGSNGNAGHDHVDGGTSRFDKFSTLYQSVCASCNQNNEFPVTPGAWSTNNNSQNCNNALFRLNIHNDFPVAECQQPQVGCAIPYTVQFDNTGRGDNFYWDFGDGTTSTEHSPQHTYNQSGTYRVLLVAYMANGCAVSDSTHVTVRILDSQGATSVAQTECSDNPIQIGETPIPGCSYLWLTEGVSNPNIANPYVFGSGTYLLQISTADGCTEVDTFVVSFLNILDHVAVTKPTCPGYQDGSATAILSQTPDDIRYYWDGIEGGATLTGLSADGITHTLRIESQGCTWEETFTVTDPPTMQYTEQHSIAICNDTCDGWMTVTYGYPDGHTHDTTIYNLCEGEHTLYFTDTAGCPYSATCTIIEDNSMQQMEAWADRYEVFLSQSVRLHVTPVDGGIYSWTDPATLQGANTANPLATPDQEYMHYEVEVTNPNNCYWSGSVDIHCTEVICGAPNIFIPNAFSPNNDGVNDQLRFSGQFVLSFEISIYSRWGEKVFEAHDINDFWDGRYNGTPCLPGVYTYYCKVKCEAGFENLLKGDITLIR